MAKRLDHTGAASAFNLIRFVSRSASASAMARATDSSSIGSVGGNDDIGESAGVEFCLKNEDRRVCPPAFADRMGLDWDICAEAEERNCLSVLFDVLSASFESPWRSIDRNASSATRKGASVDCE